MNGFKSKLVVTPLDNGRDWELVKTFTYHVGSKKSPLLITVPIGFITDYASVPRFFWRLCPPTGKGYTGAAVIHDYLYRQPMYSRLMADAIFLEAMQVGGVPRWKRWIMFSAVRLFGRSSYRSKQEGLCGD